MSFTALTYSEYCERYGFDINDDEIVNRYKEYLRNVNSGSLDELHREGKLPGEIFD